ncbi:hypothetical protein BDV33DRAFT_210320 [Aspergillus novoparasiticus]|uniref:Transcription factor domain-containing protein n=1 Tax=Aspergillus novoparasiticus TaxID=986946 RepID=A0A5N6E7L1_9EURO|nr:hypothetical protein BDV33DRAFT_210320 [Aspergillus novoparasiticus]
MSGFTSAESREGSEQPYARDIYFKDFTPSRSITPFGVWDFFPGVRMGWLSAEEAMIFVNYFFQNLAPWSTVLMEPLTDPIDYGTFVGEEPLLAQTVLMISSRYHSLPGSSGQARVESIHNKLWERCRNLLLDTVLGQGPKGITRSIGTIEALVLMIEWHPGSLHSRGIESADRHVTEYQLVPNGGRQSQETANPYPIQLVSYVELSLVEWFSEYTEFHSYYKSCIMSAIILKYHYVQAYAYSLALLDDPIHIMPGQESGVTAQSSATYPETSVKSITDAIVASTTTFFQIIRRFGESGELKYAPDHVFVRTAGASVLLLKAVPFLSPATQTDEYLDMLSNVVRVLREKAVDLLHICTQYADLLDTQAEAHRRQHIHGQNKDLDNVVRELFQVQV